MVAKKEVSYEFADDTKRKWSWNSGDNTKVGPIKTHLLRLDQAIATGNPFHASVSSSQDP